MRKDDYNSQTIVECICEDVQNMSKTECDTPARANGDLKRRSDPVNDGEKLE